MRNTMQLNIIRAGIVAVGLLVLLAFGAEAAVWYVDVDNVSGTYNGTSWATAFTSIQAGVTAASSGGGEVWVAEGTYTGTGDNVVVMAEGVHLYGGFAATETARSERDWTDHITSIDGEDTRRGVVGASNATLDGFTVTRGYAGGGGGMLNANSSSPTVTNCTFSGNSTNADGGGGMCNYDSSPTVMNCIFSGNTAAGWGGGGGMVNYSYSSPTVTNCMFSGNTASGTYDDSGGGGGMCNESSSPTVTNCMFSGNTATYEYGGGGGMVNAYSSSPSVTNCTFSDNSTGGSGGGMFNYSYSTPYSAPTVTNCMFSGNDAYDSGGGMFNYNSTPTVTNCILWGHAAGEISGATATVTYSCVQGGYVGAGNLAASPYFVDAANGDLRLAVGSPCLDAGTAVGAPLADIRGTVRPQGTGIDIGVYEMSAAEFASMDADSDGMLDTWEAYYGVDDPNADPDDDGATNLEEYLANTHPLVAGGVWYVDVDNPSGIQDGTSWPTAFKTIQAGVDAASSGGGQVWVAEGTYTGTGDNVVVMASGVHLYGGFAATEIIRDERNWTEHITIIDAQGTWDVPGRGVLGANGATLDGFTATRGGYVEFGGGMYNNAASPTVTNCTFSGNLASWGNGMYNSSSSSPTVTNCTFSGNGPDYYGYGGGMCNDASSPTVTDCTFSGNSAGYGGGMYNVNSSSPTVTNCTFSGNTAWDGGGMYNNASTPTLTNCTFSGNVAGWEGGGGMYNYDGSSPTLTDCTFSSNTAISGGGMENDASSPTLTNCTFSGNWAAEGGGMYNDNSSPTVALCVFSDNTTIGGGGDSNGGGMYNVSSSPTVTLCTFSDNTAGYDGGGGMCNFYFSSPTVTECTFSGNTASTEYTSGSGGGMFNGLDSSPTLTLCMFSNNTAPGGSGGGICNGGSSSPAVTECTFSGNSAGGGGGGMCNDASSPTVTDCTFSNNSAPYGGGMFGGGSPVLTNCTFSGNSASGDSWSSGGGLCISGGSPVLMNCVFSGNTATGLEGGGGGLSTGGCSASLTNCMFLDNSTDGYYGGGGMCNHGGSLTLTNCEFSGNSAAGDGGGMCNDGGSATVTDCTFEGNSASVNYYGGGGGGGGLYADGGSLTLTNCEISGNSAAGGGGGGMYTACDSPAVLTNCTFSCNSATYVGYGGGDGGGLYIGNGSPTVTNCTFTGNLADGGSGGGIYSMMFSPTVTNCILWGDMPDEIAGTPAAVSYSCVQGGYAGEGNLAAWPCLVDAANGNLLPAVSSPCLDVATASGAPSEDIRGVPRPQGAGIDMGAYETTPAELASMDLDSDGMLDAWEARYGVDDPNADPDGDDATNLEEYLANTNPLTPFAYVDVDNVSGIEDGTSWATAFTSIQAGVDAASSGGGEVWVAEGTYTATSENVVVMASGVRLYGGFDATETSRDQRNWTEHETIIDGEDTRRGVVGASNAMLDGFTVTQGYREYWYYYDGGGGMYNYGASPTVTNCTFSGNSAGYGCGMYNESSSPTVTNCTFSGNTVEGWPANGGGMYNSNSSPTVTNCTFSGNSAGYDGGGMYNYGGSPTLTNCTFSGNFGGGMSNESSSPTVTSCTFSANTAYGGGGMSNG